MVDDAGDAGAHLFCDTVWIKNVFMILFTQMQLRGCRSVIVIRTAPVTLPAFHQGKLVPSLYRRPAKARYQSTSDHQLK